MADYLKKLWKRVGAEGDFTCFPRVDAPPHQWGCRESSSEDNFNSYFPDMEDTSAQLIGWDTHLSLLKYQEKLLEVKFDTSTLIKFWVCAKKEHPELGRKALEQLLPFESTVLCEVSFSAMTKNKAKKQTVPGKGLITAVASLPQRMRGPRFSLNCKCILQFNETTMPS